MLIANPPYMGIKTFLQVPYSPDLSKSPKVAILGIPYDLNVTNRPGPLVAEECSTEGKSGCSGLILLYESHAAIHTYVDLKEAFIDIFSCREFNVESVQGTINEFFGSHEIVEEQICDRGFHWQTNLQQTLKEWTTTRV